MFFSLKCLINQIEIMEEIMVTYIDFEEQQVAEKAV